MMAIKFAFLDTNNIYSNIHTKEIITVRKLGEINNVEDKAKEDILKITQVIVEQNYFHFQDTIYLQNHGIAMGVPTSSILSQVYLQELEKTKIAELLLKHKIEGYFGNFDDILIIYKEDQTNIRDVLDNFNNMIYPVSNSR